jgi:hypothetical protein
VVDRRRLHPIHFDPGGLDCALLFSLAGTSPFLRPNRVPAGGVCSMSSSSL